MQDAYVRSLMQHGRADSNFNIIWQTKHHRQQIQHQYRQLHQLLLTHDHRGDTRVAEVQVGGDVQVDVEILALAVRNQSRNTTRSLSMFAVWPAWLQVVVVLASQ